MFTLIITTSTVCNDVMKQLAHSAFSDCVFNEYK